MNILIIHNRYSTSGGEESVAAMQENLFREKGNNVYTYYRSHSEMKNGFIGKAQSFFTSLCSPKAIRDIKKIITDNNINIAFIHNLYPFISPAILPTLRKSGVKTVLFTHNYRLICPTGLFFRNGIACEKCGGCLKELNAIRYQCEGSLVGSIAHAARNFSARIFKLYKNNIDHYAALTEFQRGKLIKYGFDPKKIAVIPNFTTFTPSEPITHKNGKVLFVGRLSEEKGYDILFDAARRLPQVEFTVAGSYSNQTPLTNLPKNITLLGVVNKQTITDLYQTHSLIAITSRCYEAFPLTILEAAMNHCPVIAPSMGAMQSIIINTQTGLLFKPYSPEDLSKKITLLLNHPELAANLTTRNFEICTKLYSPDKYYNSIISL